MFAGRLTLCLIFSALFLTVFSHRVFALDKSDDIDTNRPSFMFSPLVVPRGSVQIENGGLYQHFQHGGSYFDASETQVRVGLTKRAEFQMFVPYYVGTSRLRTDDTPSGVSGLSEVGFKYQLAPLKKLQISVIPSVNIPTGNKDIYFGKGVQGLLRAPWSYPLTPKLSIMGMQSILLLNSGRSVEYQPDFMLSRSIGSKASVFAEYVGFFTQQLSASQIAHFGAVYKVKPHHQIDMHFGFGLDKTAPAAFIGTGYSYRFDKLPW
ncbi:MAG TPA: transporter [Drouetiella sp.]